MIAELQRAKRASEAPWKLETHQAEKFGYDVSVRASVRPYRLGGRGRGVSRSPRREAKECHQPRSQSSSAISDVTLPVKLVGKIRLARTGLGTRLECHLSSAVSCLEKSEKHSFQFAMSTNDRRG